MPGRRAILALATAALLLAVGGAWLELSARQDGFAHGLDRRTARLSGILDASEWRAMEAAGDRAAPASGGDDDACGSATCREAEARLGGRWRRGEDCASGSRYRFADGTATVEDYAAGQPGRVARRSYRLVGAPAAVPLGRDGYGRPLAGTVWKKAGDVEVWTLGRSSYLRRVLRRRDPDTVDLVLVQARLDRAGPVATLYVDGRSTGGQDEAVYRRCPDPIPR